MENKIKRYVPHWFNEEMFEVENGGWVLYEDHAREIDDAMVEMINEFDKVLQTPGVDFAKCFKFALDKIRDRPDYQAALKRSKP